MLYFIELLCWFVEVWKDKEEIFLIIYFCCILYYEEFIVFIKDCNKKLRYVLILIFSLFEFKVLISFFKYVLFGVS